ncbi:uncharacterized protein LOC122392463 [Amphibalanus amphitrite]|uniref:uncharacterized protein LOC122392463 n=1 Tax=Amphibalanus amphitrite TaxID=1232801 RepID=UPI001C90560C|nr:uncharacterized protein LOC122392463 [Amphibalanus amphitrite]
MGWHRGDCCRPAMLSSLLLLWCAVALGQDIVFQQPTAFGSRPVFSDPTVDAALQLPLDVGGSGAELLRFGGSFDCRTPDGQLGRCGPLLSCDHMRKALLPLTTARLRFLKKSICRFVGGRPLICCPERPPQLTPTTSAPLFFEVSRRPPEPTPSPPTPPPPSPSASAGLSPVSSTEVASPPAAQGTTVPEAPDVEMAKSEVTGVETAPVASTPEASSVETTPEVSVVETTTPDVASAETSEVTGVETTAEETKAEMTAPETTSVEPAPEVPSEETIPEVTVVETITEASEAVVETAPEASSVETTPEATGVDTAATPEAVPTDGPSTIPPPGLDVCGHKLVERITGGQESQPNSWPWLAALGYQLERRKIDFLCGGVLITEWHILTAAHCVKEQLKVIRLGDHDLFNDTEVDTVTEHGIAEMMPHEEYNNRTLFNDIAIVKLRTKVDITGTVHPICLPLLPEMRNLELVRQITFIAGWGTTSFKGEASPVLREARVRVHRQQLCKQRYRALRHRLADSQICASAREGGENQDTCQGDSGGPMMMPGVLTPNWYVMGVVSFGFRCGEPRFPGVYTRVTDYLDWIVDHLSGAAALMQLLCAAVLALLVFSPSVTCQGFYFPDEEVTPASPRPSPTSIVEKEPAGVPLSSEGAPPEPGAVNESSPTDGVAVGPRRISGVRQRPRITVLPPVTPERQQHHVIAPSEKDEDDIMGGFYFPEDEIEDGEQYGEDELELTGRSSDNFRCLFPPRKLAGTCVIMNHCPPLKRLTSRLTRRVLYLLNSIKCRNVNSNIPMYCCPNNLIRRPVRPAVVEESTTVSSTTTTTTTTTTTERTTPSTSPSTVPPPPPTIPPSPSTAPPPPSTAPPPPSTAPPTPSTAPAAKPFAAKPTPVATAPTPTTPDTTPAPVATEPPTEPSTEPAPTQSSSKRPSRTKKDFTSEGDPDSDYSDSDSDAEEVGQEAETTASTDAAVDGGTSPAGDTDIVPTTEEPAQATGYILPRPPRCGYRNVTGVRIVGGVESEVAEWPWMAALGYDSHDGDINFHCGGALITNKHVLTAAHCVQGKEDSLNWARIGDHDLTNDTDVDTAINYGIKEHRIHEEYNNRTFANDIAILVLREPVEFNYARHTVCLPFEDEVRTMVFDAKKPFIAGWGATSYRGSASAKLLHTQVRVMRKKACSRRYTRFRQITITDKVLCARSPGKDSCQGDSGGPMMFPSPSGPYFYTIGVVSFGYKCADARVPGVYTRVSEYLDWITSHLHDTD